MDRFSEPIERKPKPEPDAIDAYKQLRDMEQIDFKENEVRTCRETHSDDTSER